jgi:hypothetical protein
MDMNDVKLTAAEYLHVVAYLREQTYTRHFPLHCQPNKGNAGFLHLLYEPSRAATIRIRIPGNKNDR